MLPMFPLSVVLLPGGVLPLQIFEDRYRQLMADLLAGEGVMQFGIPPILRGTEVGGGEVRADVASVARVIEPRVMPDGRYTLLAVAESRVEVVKWLPDDPYPQAEVRHFGDQPGGGDIDLESIARRALRLARQAGLDVASTDSLPENIGAALFALGVMAPIADLDRLAMLRTTDVSERASLLTSALDDLEAVLKFKES